MNIKYKNITRIFYNYISYSLLRYRSQFILFDRDFSDLIYVEGFFTPIPSYYNWFCEHCFYYVTNNNIVYTFNTDYSENNKDFIKFLKINDNIDDAVVEYNYYCNQNKILELINFTRK